MKKIIAIAALCLPFVAGAAAPKKSLTIPPGVGVPNVQLFGEKISQENLGKIEKSAILSCMFSLDVTGHYYEVAAIRRCLLDAEDQLMLTRLSADQKYDAHDLWESVIRLGCDYGPMLNPGLFEDPQQASYECMERVEKVLPVSR